MYPIWKTLGPFIFHKLASNLLTLNNLTESKKEYTEKASKKQENKKQMTFALKTNYIYIILN